MRAYGRIGRGRNVNVEPTLGQRMHSDCVRCRVMVGRATLAQRQRMVGLVAVGMSTSSQLWANVCISSEREVGWWSGRQRWPNVSAWSDWLRFECRRRANVGPTYAFQVNAKSGDVRPGNVGPTSAHGRIGRGRNVDVDRANVGPTYLFQVNATSGDGRLGNVVPTSLHGRIGRGGNVNVKPTLGKRMQFECARRHVMVGRTTLAQRRCMVRL